MTFCKHGPWHFIMELLLQESAVITSCVSIIGVRNQKNTRSNRDFQWRATIALWWKERLSVGAAANFIPERSFRALRRRFLPFCSLRFLFPSKHIFIRYVIKHDKIGSMECRHSKPWLVILCRHKGAAYKRFRKDISYKMTWILAVFLIITTNRCTKFLNLFLE
jgi:hypothetical protein